ncbi:MAG TPA: hypothetical protein VHD35_11630 [Chitinophagaceae bacterium]|nr:hypothetical protein [Chitinophagaceae bacterium]
MLIGVPEKNIDILCITLCGYRLQKFIQYHKQKEFHLPQKEFDLKIQFHIHVSRWIIHIDFYLLTARRVKKVVFGDLNKKVVLGRPDQKQKGKNPLKRTKINGFGGF